MVEVGIALGSALTLGVAFAAWRGRHVAAWAAILGPLFLLAGARRPFAALHADTRPVEIAAAFEGVIPAAVVLVALGLVAWLSGIGARLIGRGAPSLAAVGAASVGFGLVLGAWASGHATLWSSWDAPAEVVAAVLDEQTTLLFGALRGAVAATLVLGIPALVWAWVAEGWIGMGELVAAAVLVALTIRTGQPAMTGIHATYEAHDPSCSDEQLEAVSHLHPLDLGRHPTVLRHRCSGASGASP